MRNKKRKDFDMKIKKTKLRKNMKRKMGKKAFIAGSIVDLYAYLIFLLLIIVFYIIFKVRGMIAEEELRGSADMVVGNFYTSAYLRMPVDVEGHDMTMADLIRLADAEVADRSDLEEILRTYTSPGRMMTALTDTYSGLFVERTEWYWQTTFPDDICFYFVIKGRSDGEHLDYRAAESSCRFDLSDADMHLWVENSRIPIMRFRTLIPSFDPGNRIEVQLFYDVETLHSAYGARNPFYSSYSGGMIY